MINKNKLTNKNPYIKKAHQDYLDELLINKNKLKSIWISDKAIKALEDSRYNLTKFEIYKYIKSIEYLRSRGKFTINLNEGIELNQNKFRNVLIDLFYQDIPDEVILETPISSLFKFEHSKVEDPSIKIQPIEIKEVKDIKNNYDSYFGNYNTYYIFKSLIELYIDEIWLYHYKDNIYNEKELLNVYDKTTKLYKTYGSNWLTLSKLDKILIKLKYYLISVTDPEDININSLGELNLKFSLPKEKINYKFYSLPKNHLGSIKEYKLKDFWIKKEYKFN